MTEQEATNNSSLGDTQAMTNRLVRLTSQLQRWSSAQTPLENEYHISFAQVSALYAIRYGDDTPGAVAKRMRITPRAATSHIDVLESKDLLTRSNDTHDRRRTILTLTEAGTELSRDIEATALSRLSRYIYDLDPADYQVIQRSLDIMDRFLQSLRHED